MHIRAMMGVSKTNNNNNNNNLYFVKVVNLVINVMLIFPSIYVQ